MPASWMTQVFNFLAGGQYSTAPSPLANGTTGPLLCDQFGRLVVVSQASGSPVTTGTTTWSDPLALGASGIVKASAGTLFQLLGSNEGGAKAWLMIFDANAIPSNGTVPKLQEPVLAGAPFSYEFARGKSFSNGIVWAVSSTAGSYTALAGAQFWVNGEVL